MGFAIIAITEQHYFANLHFHKSSFDVRKVKMSATEVLSALDRIHGTVSVIGSMNADYTVTAQRLPGPGETITGGPLQLLPGGKSGNQAAAAAANVRAREIEGAFSHTRPNGSSFSTALKEHYLDDNWAYIPKSIRKKCAIWFRR